MTATAQPFGLKPIRHINGKAPIQFRAIPGGIPSGLAQNIPLGAPVAITTTGVINVVSTNTGLIYGVFAGCQYSVDNAGLSTPFPNWTSGATYQTGSMTAYVWEDPGIIYEIQSSGSLAQSSVGDQAAIVNGNSGQLGYSIATISSTLAGAGSTGQLSIRGLSNRVDNAWADAYTIVEVQLAGQQFAAGFTAI